MGPQAPQFVWPNGPRTDRETLFLERLVWFGETDAKFGSPKRIFPTFAFRLSRDADLAGASVGRTGAANPVADFKVAPTGFEPVSYG